MLTYLEGARFKLQSALLELDHKPRGSHPLAPHIQITRDRTGLQQSILKVPLWLKNDDEDKPNASSDSTANGSEEDATIGSRTGGRTTNTIIVDNLDLDRGIADGGSNQHDSDFGTEFFEIFEK